MVMPRKPPGTRKRKSSVPKAAKPARLKRKSSVPKALDQIRKRLAAAQRRRMPSQPRGTAEATQPARRRPPARKAPKSLLDQIRRGMPVQPRGSAEAMQPDALRGQSLTARLAWAALERKPRVPRSVKKEASVRAEPTKRGSSEAMNPTRRVLRRRGRTIRR